MKKKTVWLSTFRYVVPADFENFMESLALDGWNVEKVGQWSSIKMDFYKTEPKKYRYVFDINIVPKNDYIATYKDFGWEFVGQITGCFLWRKEYTDIRPESFTDLESIERRNRNVRNAVIFLAVIFSVLFLAQILHLTISYNKSDFIDILDYFIEIVLFGLFSAYLFWVVLKIQKNIKRP